MYSSFSSGGIIASIVFSSAAVFAFSTRVFAFICSGESAATNRMHQKGYSYIKGIHKGYSYIIFDYKRLCVVIPSPGHTTRAGVLCPGYI